MKKFVILLITLLLHVSFVTAAEYPQNSDILSNLEVIANQVNDLYDVGKRTLLSIEDIPTSTLTREIIINYINKQRNSNTKINIPFDLSPNLSGLDLSELDFRDAIMNNIIMSSISISIRIIISNIVIIIIIHSFAFLGLG